MQRTHEQDGQNPGRSGGTHSRRSGRGGSDGVAAGDGGGGLCGEGYSLIGDICEPTPEGYVETRSECEMGVDSLEAAGVEQDYQTELEKCRNAGPSVP